MGTFVSKITCFAQLTPNFGFTVQMGALEGLFSLVKIGGQEDCLPKIQWDPLDDSLETLIIVNFFRAFR